MLLTIITPTLNAYPLLDNAIKSVLRQRSDEIEHLIVDGGSSDGTLELITRYDHLRLISEPRDGVFTAMNRGLEAAMGEWVYFLGSDDEFTDERVLSDFIPILNQNYDIVYGDVVSPRFQGRYGGPFDHIRIRKQNICHQAVFFRKQVFDRVGKFDLNYRFQADWDHNMRWMFDLQIRSKYVDRVVARYGDGGVSSDGDSQFLRDRLYKYLSYGRTKLPTVLALAIWGKEVWLSLRTFDSQRLKRAFRLIQGD